MLSYGRHFLFRKFVDPCRYINSSRVANVLRCHFAYTMYISECNENSLICRQVYPGYSSHFYSPLKFFRQYIDLECLYNGKINKVNRSIKYFFIPLKYHFFSFLNAPIYSCRSYFFCNLDKCLSISLLTSSIPLIPSMFTSFPFSK